VHRNPIFPQHSQHPFPFWHISNSLFFFCARFLSHLKLPFHFPQHSQHPFPFGHISNSLFCLSRKQHKTQTRDRDKDRKHRHSDPDRRLMNFFFKKKFVKKVFSLSFCFQEPQTHRRGKTGGLCLFSFFPLFFLKEPQTHGRARTGGL